MSDLEADVVDRFEFLGSRPRLSVYANAPPGPRCWSAEAIANAEAGR
jgi:hypothetical protein